MSKLSKIASLSATPNFQHPAAEFLAESNCTIDKITESIKILTENAERIKFFVDGDDIEMVENYVLSCGHLFAFFEGIEIKVPYICNYDINHDEFTSCWLNNESDSDESFTITVDGKIQQYCDEEEIQFKRYIL